MKILLLVFEAKKHLHIFQVADGVPNHLLRSLNAGLLNAPQINCNKYCEAAFM